MVHFLEWTTSSRFIGSKARNSAFFQEASGPLTKVDHWLTLFRGKCLISVFFLEASGPLFRVDHWRAPNKAAATQKALQPLTGAVLFALFAYSRWGLILRTLRARMTRPYWRWAIPRE